MKDGQMQDINIEIESFGAEAIMQIQQVKIQKRYKNIIQNQLKEDQIAEQLELEIEDPFTGKKK